MKFTIVLGLMYAACTLALPAATDFGGRVWNGADAVPHSAPYMIQMARVAADGTEQHNCGGAILNSRWVVTAAHCVNNVPDTVLVAGQHDNTVVQSWEQRRQIERFIIHEDYCGSICPNDIALIYVNQPFIFDEFVQPIQLPGFEQVPTGTGRLFGWGGITNTTQIILPNILQTADKPILPFATCQQFYGTLVDATNLCTGPLDGSTAACNADSGGPLVQFDGNNQPIVVGLVSWGGFPCGRPNSPNVYVRVSAFIEWIYTNVGLNTLRN